MSIEETEPKATKERCPKCRKMLTTVIARNETVIREDVKWTLVDGEWIAGEGGMPEYYNLDGNFLSYGECGGENEYFCPKCGGRLRRPEWADELE
jgi:hypothetical protein